MRKSQLYIIPLIALMSCIDPINFDVPNDSTFLVVDGFITDDYGPHRIKLSRSAKYASIFNDGEEKSVSGASLSIVDNLGATILLQEVFDGEGREGDSTYSGKIGYNGNYQTSASFKGVVGNDYYLQIEVNGETYQSNKETLLSSSPIDSVTYSYVSKPYLDESNKVVSDLGVEFYATFISTSDATHYKWDWENTFILDQVLAPPSPIICYATESPTAYVNVLENESFQTTHQNYPVSFVPVNFKFNYKYSMNLILYSMSDRSAEFWNFVSTQLDVTGSIFDPAPTIISGNIQNINDSNEIVLGYFGAFGKSEKRVFIDNFEVGELTGNMNYIRIEACFPGSPAPPPAYCTSCIFYPGSQFQKPDFWE